MRTTNTISAQEVTTPTLKDGALQYDSYHGRIAFSSEKLGHAIQRAVEKAVVTKLDINTILDEIQRQRAMLDSPEAKEIVEQAQKDRQRNAPKKTESAKPETKRPNNARKSRQR